MKRRPLFLLPLIAAAISGFPRYATDPDDGVVDPGTDDGDAAKDERSPARKFMDKLKSNASHAAENDKLRKQLADAQKQITTLTSENETLAGAAEAASETADRLTFVESALGLTPGAIQTASAAEIKKALDLRIAAAVTEEVAKAGVPPTEKLPKPNREDAGGKQIGGGRAAAVAANAEFLAKFSRN